MADNQILICYEHHIFTTLTMLAMYLLVLDSSQQLKGSEHPMQLQP